MNSFAKSFASWLEFMKKSMDKKGALAQYSSIHTYIVKETKNSFKTHERLYVGLEIDLAGRNAYG